MPSPIVGAIGGGLASAVGGIFAGRAQRSAARSQAAASREATALQREIFQQQQELLRPFREAGTEVGLPGLLSLVSPEGRTDFLNQYFQSPEFATLAQQGQRGVLSAAAAGGQLGGSATQNELRRIAPTLGLQALGQQFSQFGQLAGMGQAAAAGTAQFGGQFAQQAGQLIQQRGRAEGQAAAAFPAAFGNIFGQVGGFALGRGIEGAF